METERRPGGRIEKTLTVFLTGAECPFTCSFCDLWRWTIDGPTTPGAPTHQLAEVLKEVDAASVDRIKLYNASNFFDPRAVPVEDVDGIAALTAPFASVTVESHAATIGPKTVSFARKIPARLEVAMGLETIHPAASEQINKRLELARFDSAAGFLLDNGMDLRVFVLLGTPYIPVDESVDWTVRTVEYAASRGAAVVSIIPVRGGNGEMERLQALGHYTPPTLRQLEDALDRCSRFASTVVTADLWDVERLGACPECAPARIERMRHFNVTGQLVPRTDCVMCQS